jgi:hypothetical protein
LFLKWLFLIGSWPITAECLGAAEALNTDSQQLDEPFSDTDDIKL